MYGTGVARRLFACTVAAAVATTLAGVTPAGAVRPSSSAAAPSAALSPTAPAGSATSTTFATAGGPFSYTVPATADGVQVVAVGGSGASTGSAGGYGAQVVSYYDQQTAPGGTPLTVFVGGTGGGAGFDDGGGGGGASTVNVGSRLSLSGPSTVIAGGGGGAGSDAAGGAAGNKDGSGFAGQGISGGKGGHDGVGGRAYKRPGKNGAGGPGGSGAGDDGGSGGVGPTTTAGAGGNGLPGWAGGGGGGGYGGGGAGAGYALGDGGGGGGSLGPQAGDGTPTTVYSTATQVAGGVTITTAAPATGVTAQPKNSGTVLVSWNSATQPASLGTGSDEVLYSDGNGPTQSTGLVSSPALVTGLTDGQDYTFSIRTTTSNGPAVDSAGTTATPTAPPRIESVTPAHGRATGGTPVTIAGSNFVTGSQVRVGGRTAANVTVQSDAEITAVTPVGTERTVDVVVESPNGQATRAVSAFTYDLTPPVIHSVMPTRLPQAPAPFVIRGRDFDAAATVTVAGLPATGVSVAPRRIDATSPAGLAPGLYDVTVSNAEGVTRTLPDALRVLGAPTVDALSPTVGSVAGGVGVTITGTGFSTGTSVTFGGEQAEILSRTSTQMYVVTPPVSDPGAVDVVVSDDATPPQEVTEQDGFTYATSSFTPATGTSGSYSGLGGVNVVSLELAGGGGGNWDCQTPGSPTSGGAGALITQSVPTAPDVSYPYAVGGQGTSDLTPDTGDGGAASGGGSTNFGAGTDSTVIAGGGGGANCNGDGGAAGLAGGAGGNGAGDQYGGGAPGDGNGGSGGGGENPGGAGGSSATGTEGGAGGGSVGNSGGFGVGSGTGGEGAEASGGPVAGGGGGGYGGGGGGGVPDFGTAGAGGGGGSLAPGMPGLVTPQMAPHPQGTGPGSLTVTALDPPQVQVSAGNGSAVVQWAMDGDTDYFVSVDDVPQPDSGTAPVTLTLPNGQPADVTVTAYTGATDALEMSTTSAVHTVTPGTSPALSQVTTSGTPAVDQTIDVGVGSVTGTPTPQVTYQWFRADSLVSPLVWEPIPNATSSSYRIGVQDFAYVLRARVTADNGVGSKAVKYSPATAPVAGEPPQITSVEIGGDQAVGGAVTSSVDVTAFPTADLSYQWQSSVTGTGAWQNIPGAIGGSYSPTPSVYGQYVRVQVNAANGFPPATSQASSASAQIAGEAPGITTVDVSGSAELGQPLTAAADGVSGTPDPAVSYVWESAPAAGGPWSLIVGADSATFTPAPPQAGQWLRVVATATNGVGEPADVVSQPLGPVVGTSPRISSVSITGTARMGSTLTAQPQGVAGVPAPTVSYQWQVGNAGSAGSWSNVAGATRQSWQISAAAAQKRVRVVATAANGVAPEASAFSPVTALVPGVAPGVRAVTFTGALTTGSTLTARVAGVTGKPTPALTYVWQARYGTGGAWRTLGTAPRQPLAPATAGAQVRLTVTARNGVVPAAVRVSPVSRPIAGPNPTITSLAPTRGPVKKSTTLRLRGSGFAVGSTVTVGGRPCTPVSVTATTISCTGPKVRKAGKASVVVTTPAGQQATAPTRFRYVERR